MLTIENLEKVFSKVCGVIGKELQSTSTYLMRAKSASEMAEELDMTVEEILEHLSKRDAARFSEYGGPIIWTDYNKTDFNLLLDDTEDAIQEFVDTLRRS